MSEPQTKQTDSDDEQPLQQEDTTSTTGESEPDDPRERHCRGDAE